LAHERKVLDEAEQTSEKVFSGSRQASGGIVVSAKVSPSHAIPLPPKCPFMSL